MKGIDNTMKQTTQDTGAAAKAAAREERDSRNARVLACARGLVAGNSAFPALQIPSDGSGSADDMALVLCHHGLEDARLDRAKVLLKRHDADIAGLPALCGFRTASALRAAFRRRSGMSMTEWRRKNCAHF